MIHIELWMALNDAQAACNSIKQTVDKRRLGTPDGEGYRVITRQGEVVVAADGKVLFIPSSQITWFSKSVLDSFEHGKFGQVDVGAEEGICDECGRPW